MWQKRTSLTPTSCLILYTYNRTTQIFIFIEDMIIFSSLHRGKWDTSINNEKITTGDFNNYIWFCWTCSCNINCCSMNDWDLLLFSLKWKLTLEELNPWRKISPLLPYHVRNIAKANPKETLSYLTYDCMHRVYSSILTPLLLTLQLKQMFTQTSNSVLLSIPKLHGIGFQNPIFLKNENESIIICLNINKKKKKKAQARTTLHNFLH